jgi:phage terminase large subunit-like protein
VHGAVARAVALDTYSGAIWCAGRGYGKTRIGAQSTNEEAEIGGPAFRGALIGRTAADVRDVMIEGESGILAVSRPDFRPVYEPSKRRLTWPNGAIATAYSADTPDQLRGPQHSWAWPDEIAAWPYRDTWDQVRFGLRLGAHPRYLVTTTPRPTSLVRDLLADPRCKVTTGTTYDNAANLPPDFLETLRRRYEGTTIGRQEIYAEVMDEAPGALWRRSLFQRMDRADLPELDRIVVAVDPSATASDTSDEAGIMAGGSFRRGGVLHAVLLGDYSGRLRPAEWSKRGIEVYDMLRAGRLVGEVNNGGDMVEDLVRMVAKEMQRNGGRASAEVSYRSVWASEGKKTRAEPVVALYEQGRVHHLTAPRALSAEVSGGLRDLEDEQCNWVPGEKSPNRMDAAVWLLTDLILDAEQNEAPPMSLNYASMARRSPVRGR